jgi:hypothetical protein
MTHHEHRFAGVLHDLLCDGLRVLRHWAGLNDLRCHLEGRRCRFRGALGPDVLRRDYGAHARIASDRNESLCASRSGF